MEKLDHSTLEGTMESLAQLMREDKRERLAMKLVKENRVRISRGLECCGHFGTGLAMALRHADSSNTKTLVKAWPELIIRAHRLTEAES